MKIINKILEKLLYNKNIHKDKKEMDEIDNNEVVSEKPQITEILPVSSPLPKPRQYQWIRGERVGAIEEYKEKKVKGNQEWVYFQSGKRIASNLISEFMIEINERQQPLDLKDLSTLDNPNIPKKINPITESYKSPVRILLEKQKKFESVSVTHVMEINLPSPSLYEVMLDNFGDEVKSELTELLLGKLNTEEIREQLKQTIIKTIDNYYNTNTLNNEKEKE